MSLRAKVYGLRLRAASWVAGKAIQAHYAGASTSRLFLDWAAGRLSPDSALYVNLTILRDRARQLERDNELVNSFLQALEDNVIGPKGIQLRPQVTGPDGKPAKETNWAILSAWKKWGFPENASADCVDSWLDVEKQHIRAIARDGESIIRRINGADNEFGLAVQLVDPDLLDETYNVAATSGSNEIRMGVERDRFGRPIAYHLWTRHPADIFRGAAPRERVRVDAADIIHDFVRTRPGQSRGVTWFAPVLTSLKMAAGYLEAELIAARLEACQTAFITTTEEQAVAQYLAERSRKSADKAAEDDKPLPVEPAIINRLRPGEQVQMFDPKHPAMAFAEFTKTIYRTISRGLGVAYHTLTGDLADANYSSLRAGLLPERDHWRALQVWLSTRMHRRVYRWWLPAALASGQLVVPQRRVAAELGAHSWKGRGWKWVDPLKDLQAMEIELRLGLTSRQHLHGESGTDFEETIDELRYEQEYASGEGVDVMPVKKSSGRDRDEDDDNRTHGRHLAVVGS